MTFWPTPEEQEYEAFLTSEAPPPTPVESRFVLHHFVSASKGRTRTRKRPKEVDLIADRWEPKRPLRYRTERRFPFDVKATEVYGDPQAEAEMLRSAIMRLQ